MATKTEAYVDTSALIAFLADAHGLVIINERRISTCWSTDRHLRLTSAELVISAGRRQGAW
jgi:hypothetical protein